MLKTVSSITNAIGALNYKGVWNASTNSPALASGVGTKGDYYVVSVAGATNLDGETLWGVGDWAVFNGTAWQRLEGGSTINATTVSASTSVTTPVIQATSPAGGTLKNNGGTAQLQWGSGGGSNLSLEVATNINPANAAVDISPTGTGTVTINPTAVGDMDNMVIGATTPKAITGTTITATTFSGAGTSLTGTATAFTASNVTTNANLTGPITSVGNATSIASQTGTGTKFVVDNTPTLITPVLGVATATSINKMAITAPATSSTLAVADGKTLTASNSLTLAGTDGTTQTFPATSATIARTDAAQTFTGTQTVGALISTGHINGAYRYAQGLSLAGGGGAVTITITAFTYSHVLISLGGIIAAYGGVSGLYLANYSNTITTIDAAPNIVVTCADATGSITVTNNYALVFNGTIIIEVR